MAMRRAATRKATEQSGEVPAALGDSDKAEAPDSDREAEDLRELRENV